VGEGVASGLKTAAAGIAAGVAGLVLAPVVGAKQEGVTGFAKGMATGVVGAVVLPVSGIVGGAVQVGRGVVNEAEAVEAKKAGKVWNKVNCWGSWDVRVECLCPILCDDGQGGASLASHAPRGGRGGFASTGSRLSLRLTRRLACAPAHQRRHALPPEGHMGVVGFRGPPRRAMVLCQGPANRMGPPLHALAGDARMGAAAWQCNHAI
jgi:hypothetical protein